MKKNLKFRGINKTLKNNIFKFIEQDIFNVQNKYHNLFDSVEYQIFKLQLFF